MKRDYAILFAIFFVTLLFRAAFSAQTATFSDDSAYYNLRHIGHISQSAQPLIYDEFSYGGRYIIDSNIFHYIFAGFRAFLPDFVVFKILPELFFALLIFSVYGIAKRLTDNEISPLIAAFISGFIPIFIENTINTISIYSIVFPLVFYQAYCLMNIETHKVKFAVLSFVLPLVHPFAAILALSFLFYLILLNLESIKVKRQSREAIIFYTMLVLLISFILYKKAFLSFGLNALMQNIPGALLDSYFVNINVFSLISGIGIIPLILGAIGIIFGIAWEKKEPAFLLSAMILADFALLFLRLISFTVGMAFLGILLAIMCSVSIQKAIAYVKMTKFARHKTMIFACFMLLILLTLVVPSYFAAERAIASSVSSDDIMALEWIRENTPEDATILGNINEGNEIAAIAERKNVADNAFLFAPDRYNDVYTMLTTESLVKATQLMGKYSVDYVLVSEKTLKDYNMEGLKYASESCLMAEYSERAKVYRIVC